MEDLLAHGVAAAGIKLCNSLLTLRVVDANELGEDGSGTLLFGKIHGEVLDCVPQGDVPHHDFVGKEELPREDLERVCTDEGEGRGGNWFDGCLAFVLVGEKWEK